jgi:hypothetical protein
MFYRFLLVAGLVLFVVGLALPRYHDQEKFEREYAALEGPTRSKDYHQLRQRSLTASLRIQDYGLTAFSIGVLLYGAVHWRKAVTFLPKTKLAVTLLGTFSAFVVAAAQVGALLMDYARDEFPKWADSLGIPLAGVPVIFLALAMWGAAHSQLMITGKAPTARLVLSGWAWWLAFLILITSLLLITCAATGYFWLVIPCGLWITFYLSIWISRSQNRPNHTAEPASPNRGGSS